MLNTQESASMKLRKSYLLKCTVKKYFHLIKKEYYVPALSLTTNHCFLRCYYETVTAVCSMPRVKILNGDEVFAAVHQVGQDAFQNIPSTDVE